MSTHETAGPAARRVAAAAGAVLGAAGLVGCGGGSTTPGDDEYAGRAQTADPPQTTASGTASASPTAAPTPTSGPYADGRYTASESYGVVDDLVEEDSIDVALTLESGYITAVEVTGHPFTSKSQDYIDGFTQEVDGAVVGRSVEDAHVTALAGASKTSAAFNAAVDAIAGQARTEGSTPQAPAAG